MKKNDIPLHERFEELDLPRKDLPNLVGTHYRVYSDDGKFVRVEAINALEAINKSGVNNIVRIVRDTIYLNRIVDMSKMVDSAVSSAPVKSDETIVKAEEPVVQPDEEKLAEQAETLSDKEVQNLIADNATKAPEASATEANAS